MFLRKLNKVLYKVPIRCFSKDYYKILGVNKNATKQQIKQAFVKLARKHHPDQNTSEDSQKQFTDINEAYSTLSNDKKREMYDNFGMNADQ